jgi:hypothetical protein
MNCCINRGRAWKNPGRGFEIGRKGPGAARWDSGRVRRSNRDEKACGDRIAKEETNDAAEYPR